jgi:hypothetical protein
MRRPRCPAVRACRRVRAVDDLLRHVGTVQRWATGILQARATTPGQPGETAGAARRVARLGARGLVRTGVDAAGRTCRCQTLDVLGCRRGPLLVMPPSPRDRAAPPRRATVPRPTRPVDADMAGDGIDEFLDVIAPLRLRTDSSATGRPCMSAPTATASGSYASHRRVPTSPAPTPRATSRYAVLPAICCWCFATAPGSTPVEVFGDTRAAQRVAPARRHLRDLSGPTLRCHTKRVRVTRSDFHAHVVAV